LPTSWQAPWPLAWLLASCWRVWLQPSWPPVASRSRLRPGLPPASSPPFRLGLRRSLGWFLAVGQDLGDAERRQRLAMALLAPIIGAPFLLEDHDLIAELVLDHLGGNERPGDGRAAGLRTAIAAKQDN